jgi:hypothetical protein
MKTLQRRSSLSILHIDRLSSLCQQVLLNHIFGALKSSLSMYVYIFTSPDEEEKRNESLCHWQENAIFTSLTISVFFFLLVDGKEKEIYIYIEIFLLLDISHQSAHLTSEKKLI